MKTHGRKNRDGKGPSSYRMHDPDIIFKEIGLRAGDTFLDLGCGPGDYALQAANIVGNAGTVYAVDNWKDQIEYLSGITADRGITNLTGMVADIAAPLEIEDHSVDSCLMATVLHVPGVKNHADAILGEIRRILKTDGTLTIINCKKEVMPFGPPLEMRISEKEMLTMAARCGLQQSGYLDLDYNYLIRFGIQGAVRNRSTEP